MNFGQAGRISGVRAADIAVLHIYVEKLARAGLLEWAVIDPGSAIFTRFDEVARGECGFTYLNPDDHFREGMRIAAQYQARPSYAIYEAGCTRLGAATALAMPRVPTPVYRLMFSEEFCYGFPPKERYLDAHLALIEEMAPGAPWMIAGLGLDIRPLIAPAVARGGHIRVGLEDRPFGVEETNRRLVEEAVLLIRAAGGEPASPDEVRTACKEVDAVLKRGRYAQA
ncbi:MAG TPA: 3-keto-5-aminohexanoate cleavage protein [Rhabdaerophilum sp.]|nr:3-keto-5-aminohexanoate cleavage protein [Rhabdaerophilum sp.]